MIFQKTEITLVLKVDDAYFADVIERDYTIVILHGTRVLFPGTFPPCLILSPGNASVFMSTFYFIS